MSEMITGRAWILTGEDGQLINNIDTDMIFHNRYLHITEISKMGEYALDNLKGWEDFAKRTQPGDIVVAGGNFGCGSSRQQAVDCFRALGVSALVAQSFGAIYFRNAVNTGWPVLVCPEITTKDIASGDTLELDIEKGVWSNQDRGTVLPGLKQVSNVQREIMAAGGLFKLKR